MNSLLGKRWKRDVAAGPWWQLLVLTAPVIIGEIIVLAAASFPGGFVDAPARNLRERIAEMNSGGPPR
jgi:hypothetical protein